MTVVDAAVVVHLIMPGAQTPLSERVRTESATRHLGIRFVTTDQQVLAAFPETAITPADFTA